MSSILEIASLCRVSPTTVSRALNPALSHKVKPSTLERILRQCKEQEYYGKLAARSLASGKTYCIGMVLNSVEHDFASPYFALILKGVIESLAKINYNLKIIPYPCRTDSEMDIWIRKAVMGNEVDGLIISTSLYSDELLSSISNSQMPAVGISGALSPLLSLPFSTVGVNNRIAFSALCDHLQAAGYRVLAAVNNSAQDPRLLILREEADKRGIEVHSFIFPELSVHCSQQIFQMYQLVRSHWAELSRFSCWHFQIDLWAIGGMQAKKELAPDRKIFISGYDNMEENPNYATSEAELSTIEPPYRAIGETAVEMLFSQEDKVERRLLNSRFILRKT